MTHELMGLVLSMVLSKLLVDILGITSDILGITVRPHALELQA